MLRTWDSGGRTGGRIDRRVRCPASEVKCFHERKWSQASNDMPGKVKTERLPLVVLPRAGAEKGWELKPGWRRGSKREWEKGSDRASTGTISKNSAVKEEQRNGAIKEWIWLFGCIYFFSTSRVFIMLSVTFSSVQFSSVQFSSVAQSCPTLCDTMNRSMPGLPVHHQLPELT